MALRQPEKPPANYWATIVSLGSLLIAAAALISGTSKADRADAQQNERRICRLEVRANTGECGR
jgi:hypothetical protein